MTKAKLDKAIDLASRYLEATRKAREDAACKANMLLCMGWSGTPELAAANAELSRALDDHDRAMRIYTGLTSRRDRGVAVKVACVPTCKAN